MLEWGAAWLEQQDEAFRAAAPDVALAVALARCGVAADAAAEGDAGGLRAFQQLELAAALLQEHRVAPALASEILGAAEVLI